MSPLPGGSVPGMDDQSEDGGVVMRRLHAEMRASGEWDAHLARLRGIERRVRQTPWWLRALRRVTR